MVTFDIKDFDNAQKYKPQIGRWTIGEVIYVLETEEDKKQIELKLQEVTTE